MVLLLYCISLPRAAATATGPKRPGGDWARAVANQEPVGGPRSAPAWSPCALRERVRPEVRLATPPRIHAGRATASGHRAVRKHEANVRGEIERDADSEDDEWGRAGLGFGSHRQHADAVRQERRAVRMRMSTQFGVDGVPMVEANGNKPISPLSVAAEPLCVSVKELQLGRRSCRYYRRIFNLFRVQPSARLRKA